MIACDDFAVRIKYSAGDECLVGNIAGIHDVVGFQGDSVSELMTAYEAAVDHYLALAGKIDMQAKKLYSGNSV